jgi:hypothetical protein
VLAEGEAMNAVVPADDGAAVVDDRPGARHRAAAAERLGRDKAGVVAVRDKADLLRLGLDRVGQTEAERVRADLVLGQPTERELHGRELCGGHGEQEV